MIRTILIVLVVFFAGSARSDEISLRDLTALPATDILVLGEVHDNPVHHVNQAKIVREFKPKALVLEMLTPEQASRITIENRHDQKDLAEILNWSDSGWPEFPHYFQILEAAADAAIFGGNVARSEIRRAVKQGAATVFGDRAHVFGLDAALDENMQLRREELQMQAHCNALPTHILPGMVEVQRLRDATLASAAIDAFSATGGPVVIITGNGHARTDWGIGALLPRAAPRLTVRSLAQFEEFEDPQLPVDYFLRTTAQERPDPCAVFKQSD